jgi:hypothetical protein
VHQNRYMLEHVRGRLCCLVDPPADQLRERRRFQRPPGDKIVGPPTGMIDRLRDALMGRNRPA